LPKKYCCHASCPPLRSVALLAVMLTTAGAARRTAAAKLDPASPRAEGERIAGARTAPP